MNRLWDISGVDSLEVAQLLFGEDVSYLAPFQSVEARLGKEDCSVLRLGDRNFRIRYSSPQLDRLDQKVLSLQRCVWIKQHDWLSSLILPIEQLSALVKNTVVRPPHRLTSLPNHQALPARFRGIPLLFWRHNIKETPIVELQAAQKDINRLREQLQGHTPYIMMPLAHDASH